MGYVRRNYLVPMPEAESFEALNQQLLAECLAYGDHRIQGREGTVNELFAGGAEPVSCRCRQCRSPSSRSATGKVDPYATVIVDKNRYSVPTLYVGFEGPGPAGRGPRGDLP